MVVACSIIHFHPTEPVLTPVTNKLPLPPIKRPLLEIGGRVTQWSLREPESFLTGLIVMTSISSYLTSSQNQNSRYSWFSIKLSSKVYKN